MRRTLMTAALVALLAMTSCGSDGSSGTSGDSGTSVSSGSTATTTGTNSGSSADSTNIDVCGLVSTQDVSTILGQSVASTAKNDAVGSYGVCEWAPAGSGAYVARLTVGPSRLYSVLKSKQASDLAGVGDEAWSYTYGTPDAPKVDVGVSEGSYHVLLFLDPGDLEQAKSIVGKVLDALPA